MSVTKQEIVAALRATAALGEAIQELGSVPSGHLYANVCNHLSLEFYEAAIATLVRAKLIRRDGQLLVWVGPTSPPAASTDTAK